MNKQIFQYFLEKAEAIKNKHQAKMEQYVKTKAAEFEAIDRNQEDPEAVLENL